MRRLSANNRTLRVMEICRLGLRVQLNHFQIKLKSTKPPKQNPSSKMTTTKMSTNILSKPSTHQVSLYNSEIRIDLKVKAHTIHTYLLIKKKNKWLKSFGFRIKIGSYRKKGQVKSKSTYWSSGQMLGAELKRTFRGRRNRLIMVRNFRKYEAI